MWNALSVTLRRGVWVLFWKERTGSYIHVLSLYFPGERVSWLSEMSPLLKDHWVRAGRTDDVTLFVNRMKRSYTRYIYLFSPTHVCDSHVIVKHVNKRLCSVQLRLLRFPRGSLFSISGSLSTTCISCVGFEWITLCVFKQLIDLRQRRVSLSVQHFSPRTLCFFICRKVCETETDVTTTTQRLWSSLNNCTWSQML